MNNRKKTFALVIILLALVSVSLAACIRPGGVPIASSSSNGGSGGGSNTVHMGNVNFVVNTITITKGSKLTLIDDVAVPHIIQNGSWVNGTAQNTKETGAPTVQQSFNGSDQAAIGPFTTAGTFKLYCTIHTDMNLTVTVK